MSWRHWIDHGMEAQFNPRVAVGAETESWLQSWEDDAAQRKAELAGAFDIAYGPHQLTHCYHDWVAGKIAVHRG